MECQNSPILKQAIKLENQIKIEETKIREIEQKTNSQKLTTEEKYQIFTMLEKTLSPTSSQAQKDLYLKLNRIWLDVVDYRAILRNLYLMKKDLKKILIQIPFENFGKPNCSHVFVALDGHLECICCGHSSKEYHLTEEETQLLISAAKEQELLIEEVAKENIPFLKVLLVTNPTCHGAFFAQMSLDIALSHDQNKQKNTNAYYDEEELDVQTLKTNTEQNIIEDTCTSPFKGLLIQECQVAKKELKILSGENISKLFEEAQNDTEKFAVMKAYYNLSRKYFRENSDYFKNNQSADMYICLTAGQEINQMILDRKITREN